MTKYMIAIDGSEHSAKAYDIANKLMTAEDELYFVTVIPKKGAQEPRANAAAQELLDKWVARASADGVR